MTPKLTAHEAEVYHLKLEIARLRGRVEVLSSSSRMRAYANGGLLPRKTAAALADAVRAVPLEHLAAEERMQIIRVLAPPDTGKALRVLLSGTLRADVVGGLSHEIAMESSELEWLAGVVRCLAHPTPESEE